jgi:hypothetical protein
MATNWDKTNPAGTQKIRLSDEEIRDNNTALEDALSRNHNFPGNENTDAGEHTVVELQDQAGDQTTPASVIGVYNDGNVLKARLASSGRIIRLETEVVTLAKTGAYTAVLADFGKCILVTNTTTITLTAAATLGDGWHIYIKNNGSDTVTVDGDGSETIDGSTTITLLSSDDVKQIVCDGSNFHILSAHSTKPVMTFEEANHDHSDDANGELIDIPTNIPYIRLHDSKAAGTDGGTFTKDAWRKRTVTEDQDTGNHVSVASSVITLDAGTYDCLITCPANRVNNHQARLKNTSDGVTVRIGSTARNLGASNLITTSTIRGRFTIAAQKDFQIEHQCTTTRNTDGLGIAADLATNPENEIYTVAEFWKVA